MKHSLSFLAALLSASTLSAATPIDIDTCSNGTTITITSTATISPSSTTAVAASTTTTSALVTATPGTFSIAPKVLIIANAFEFTYLHAYNWTTAYTGPLFNSLFACTEDAQLCKLACGQELVSASQITALLLIPGIDLTKTYIIITGTGGVNPKHGTAGGATISTFSVQWEWGDMFLGSDLPANFSGQYFSAYAQDRPDAYPFTVGSEVYKFNQALVDRFYLTGNEVAVGGYEDVVNTSVALRETYIYEAAKRAPFLARCDVVSSQIYWHGEVAAGNVEYYTNLVTSGQATYCNTNEDDQGRVLALLLGATHHLLDFTRISMIKAFSNFDRPPPQLSAYQSRFLIGEAATAPGLTNAWKTITAVIADVMTNWTMIFEEGIKPNTYYGDLKSSLGGKCDFNGTAGVVKGVVQGQ